MRALRRYASPWQSLLEWESHPSGAALAEEVGKSVAKHDPYKHPKSTGATVTSAPLFEDGWQDYLIQNRVDPALAAIEYESHPSPFVNTGVGVGATTEIARKQAWGAAMRGHYVTLSDSGASAESPAARQMAVWRDSSRRFALFRPPTSLQGRRRGRSGPPAVPRWSENPMGVAINGLSPNSRGRSNSWMPRHEYKVSWYDPSNGAWFDQKKKFKGDRYRSHTPDNERDWVLYVRREGKKEGHNKSFVLESKKPLIREVEHSPSELPFEIELPSGNEIQAGRDHEFNATLRKNTIAARRMLWLWTGEVAGTDRGPRVLGTVQSGRFAVPGDLTPRYPATLSVRLVGIDGAGRLFEAFRPYALQAPE